jgi:pimeloyl-ACP methyl ester carboxylesterase
MQEHFFEKRGIAYRSNTFINGRPVVMLIHGLSGSASAWFAYEEKLSASYNLLIVDLRAHGNSVHPTTYADYTISHFAEDLRDLLHDLKIPKAHFVGHCFGGLVALEFMHLAPEIAESTILLSPIYKIYTQWNVRLSHFLLAQITRVAQFFFYIPHVHRGRVDYTHFVQTGDWNVRRAVTDIHAMGVEPYLSTLDHIYKYRESNTQSLTIPTLIIHGKRDSVIPFSHSVKLAAVLPKAKLELLPEGDHILVLNNVQEVVYAIENFIKIKTG